jgi:hypothetical protein
MSYLQLSGRCELFEYIAERTWAHVIRNHAVGTEVSEVGKTNDIVAEIRIAHAQNRNIGVWANNGWREIDHGSDIDVFVETQTDQFVWWALQAKVLKVDGRYDVTKPPGEEQQWTKLERLARIAGCIARYLLYNGVANFRHTDADICYRKYTQEQFGCSLLEPAEVERVSKFGRPRFNDFHPDSAEPWRIITCCHAQPQQQGLTLYTLAQVRDSVAYYEAIVGNAALLQPPQALKDQEPIRKVNELPVNVITTLSEEVGRVPMQRMVIRSTSSLKQERPI